MVSEQEGVSGIVGKQQAQASGFQAKGVNGQLTVMPDRIIISRKGMLGFMTQGLKGDKEIPLANITAIQMKQPGLTRGYIQFSIHGGIENRGGVFDATKDENTVMFSAGQRKDFEQAKTLIDQYRAALSSAQHAPAAAPLSAADELAKWAALREQGVITAEDFEAKKRQLLGL